MQTSFLNSLVKKARRLLSIIPEENNYRHVTFIVMKNKVMAVGYNKSFKSHPLAKKYGHRFNSIHSELDSILNCEFPPFMLRHMTMINLRINRNGRLAMSKPCSNCRRLIADFRLAEVYYTNREGKFVRL